MKPDLTQHQSLNGLQRAEQLSLQATVPPADVVGYRIERLLGQGSFGQVWLARDLNTSRQVAIKFYLHCGGVNWSLLSQEVKHLVNMSTGRYIVQVLGVGWEAEPPYYVMEYLENGSLEDLIRARGSLGLTEAVSMFREIADGLSFAHGRGVLHCDLKPANILLDHGLRPRLADFGQSRMSDEQTPSLGTLFFMAPEQADLHASPDVSWDVYALGAIAYTMLVGSPPYRTAEAVEKLDTANSLPERLQRYQAAIRLAPKPRLHYRRRDMDKGLCQIIDRCLAVRPEQRFSNVQQVLAAIDNRNRARLRRPLYLMGIIGPILLLLLMLTFSTRSIAIAKQESLERVQQLSLRGNQQTAKFAKLTMEGEIKSLYRLVETEARRSELRDLLSETVASAGPLLDRLADERPQSSARKQFQALAGRQPLEEYLKSRIADIIVREGNGAGIAIFNSLFVNESRGTNVGIAFSDPEEELAETPVGRNFAYRSYFNGRREDGDVQLAASHYRPTRHPHLSASFRSTSTGKWKVGISAPIWPESVSAQIESGKQPPASVQPLGVLVLTVNLGDFVLLSDVAAGNTQFTTLVDGRSGNQKGTLLQHPLLQAMDSATMRTSSMPQMNEQQLTRLQKEEGIVDYRDPAAIFPSGEKFSGTWIAAMAQVQLPVANASTPAAKIDAERLKSDLWVLVQERSSTVSAPVTELGNRLQRESYLALGVLLSLILALWFFVLRVVPSLASRSVKRSHLAIPAGGLSHAPDTALESTIDSDR